MVLNQDGIFSRAEQATDKYGQAKARETLELVLSEFQITKYEEGLSGENYENRLDSKIEEVGSLIPKEDENSKYQLVIVDGHIFEVDRSVPKIVDYKGPADGIIITAQIKQNGDWQNPVATVTGTITKYGGGSVVSSTATATEGVTITGFPTTGGSYTIPNITKDTDVTITASADDGKPAVTKTIKVRLVRDNTPPTIGDVTAKADNEMKIKIKANAIDTESGLKQINYTVIPNTITPSSGTLTSGQEIELTATAEDTEYTITFTATDNAGNTTNPGITAKAIARDGGVIKHIRTPTELKEVNTKDIYGATVNGYSCTRTGVKWQIFYIDEEDNHRVYLIAKDYMKPPTIGTKLEKHNDGKESYFFSNTVLADYKNNIIPTTDFTAKFLKELAGKDAVNTNLQATAYMLDQAIWIEYLNRNKADYAFGGPTLPLLAASYNDISKSSSKLNFNENSLGYQVSKNQGGWDYRVLELGNVNTQRGIYFKGTTDSTSCLFLASPHIHNGKMIYTSYDGQISGGYLDGYGEGFRPIVSLQSNVQFTENTDGSYTIVN